MLEATPTSINLGTVPFGKPISFSYNIKSVGGPVHITKLWVGCSSCTKATIPTEKLAEGDCVPVNVVFTPGSIGDQKKNIQVEYNGDKVLKLEFTAICTK